MPTATTLPPQIASALAELEAELSRAAGSNLAALVLYGGLARGRYDPEVSDVNVAVVLHDTSARALSAVRPALTHSRRSVGLVPLLLGVDEVADVARSFPTKFRDIQRHHVVLTGTDPFAALGFDEAAIRARTEQELHNLLLRLRRAWIAADGDPRAMGRVLEQAVRPLAVELEVLLGLAGVSAGDGGALETFGAAADAFELDRGALVGLATFPSTTSPRATELEDLFDGVLGVVARAAARASGRSRE